MTALITATLILTAASHARGPKITTRIAETIVSTWTCQDQLGAARTQARSPWKPHSPGFRLAELRRWQQRRATCLRVLHARVAMWRRLDAGLDGTPMGGTGRDLEAAGRRYGIHPAFIAAIAGTESSFGAAPCASNRFNAYGLANCGSIWGVPAFRSWRDSYLFMGRFLSSRWPGARTPFDFHGYAACSSCWGSKTEWWMRARFGVGPEVRYP